MSRIIRPCDADAGQVSRVSLDENVLAPAHPGRPRGGLAWVAPGQHTGPERASVHQRKKREAEQLIETARREAEDIQRRAYHEGFAQGEAAGQELAAQKLEPVLQSLRALIESIGGDRQALAERQEGELIKLAMLIATRVLHREIEIDHEAVIGVARAALEKVIRAEKIEIKVSPFDLEIIQQVAGAENPPDWLPANVQIEGDFKIGRGGCEIHTDSGEIDATIETQLRLLKAILWNDE